MCISSWNMLSSCWCGIAQKHNAAMPCHAMLVSRVCMCRFALNNLVHWTIIIRSLDGHFVLDSIHFQHLLLLSSSLWTWTLLWLALSWPSLAWIWKRAQRFHMYHIHVYIYYYSCDTRQFMQSQFDNNHHHQHQPRSRRCDRRHHHEHKLIDKLPFSWNDHIRIYIIIISYTWIM